MMESAQPTIYLKINLTPPCAFFFFNFLIVLILFYF